MTNPTSNFGWQMPTSTDLVTDLPADFEVFGQAVDTSLADLKGGTTGQVLKKNSNTDMDFVWSADSAGMTNPMTTTGDTIYSSSGSTPARLGIGTTGQVLTVAGGLPAWSTPGGSLDNYQLLNAGGTALTGTNTITISGISGKNSLWVYVVDVSSASASSNIIFRLNADSGSNYNFSKLVFNNSSMAVAGGNDASFPFAQTGNTAASKINIGFAKFDGTGTAGIKTYDSWTACNGTAYEAGVVGGFYSGTSAITSLSIISGVGNFDQGTIYVYGA
jgi:hypothetical protein